MILALSKLVPSARLGVPCGLIESMVTLDGLPRDRRGALLVAHDGRQQQRKPAAGVEEVVLAPPLLAGDHAARFPA